MTLIQYGKDYPKQITVKDWLPRRVFDQIQRINVTYQQQLLKAEASEKPAIEAQQALEMRKLVLEGCIVTKDDIQKVFDPEADAFDLEEVTAKLMKLYHIDEDFETYMNERINGSNGLKKKPAKPSECEPAPNG